MAYLNKYGSLWGAVPQTSGRVFWVAAADSFTLDGTAYPASDDNDGLSPERPLRRVNRAWALCTANAGDIIMLLPGTHVAAAAGTATATSIAANVAGVTMMGLPSMGGGNMLRPRASLNIDAADQTVNVTAADIEIAHIGFVGVAGQTAIATLDYSAAANRLYIHDCLVDVTAQTISTSILGFDALGAAAFVVFERCHFMSDGAFGAMIDLTGTTDSLVQDCIFTSTTGTLAAAITCGAATDRATIRRNILNDGAGTITVGVNGTGATIAGGVLMSYNYGGVTTTLAANFTSGEAELCNNYQGGVGAGAGGALYTATA
jgi:hypothetical protein